MSRISIRGEDGTFEYTGARIYRMQKKTGTVNWEGQYQRVRDREKWRGVGEETVRMVHQRRVVTGEILGAGTFPA